MVISLRAHPFKNFPTPGSAQCAGLPKICLKRNNGRFGFSRFLLEYFASSRRAEFCCIHFRLGALWVELRLLHPLIFQQFHFIISLCVRVRRLSFSYRVSCRFFSSRSQTHKSFLNFQLNSVKSYTDSTKKAQIRFLSSVSAIGMP